MRRSLAPGSRRVGRKLTYAPTCADEEYVLFALYVADLTNFTVYVLNRDNLTELGRFGTGGRQAGTFHWPHTLSVDSEGNIYVGEVDGAGRVQKFLTYGVGSCSGTGNPKIGEYLE